MNENEIQTENPVYILAASPDFIRDRIVFAARASGLAVSDDGGKSWHDAFESLNLEEDLTTTTVCLSPDFRNDRLVFAGIPGGIWWSKNGGINWQNSKINSPPAFFTTIVSSPNFAKDGTLFAGTMEDGVLLSADGGVEWNPWNFGLIDSRVMALSISPNFGFDETLFAGTETGVFKSTNSGHSWRETSFPPELGPVLCLGISPNYGQDATLFVGTESFGLLKTTDGGQTWNRLSESLIPDLVNSIVISPDYQTKPELYVQITDRLLVSLDGGKSWADYKSKALEGIDISCFIAPLGLRLPAKLMVGTTEGMIILV